jgi:hypothetical protein
MDEGIRSLVKKIKNDEEKYLPAELINKYGFVPQYLTPSEWTGNPVIPV